MGRVVVLVLVFFIFCKAGFAFSENSAIFRIITTTPPSAQAGKEIVFEIEITNTGSEAWVAGEYSVFIKVYDTNKSYLTETDKTRQFEDIAPAEALAVNIDFDIPADYSGTYHYRVGMEFEEEALFSHYFILRVLPLAPVPEVKKLTGSIQINYQDNQAIEPTTSLNLRLVSLLPVGSYLRFSTSGRSTPSINPELSNFFISYHSQKLDLSAGDFATGLSELTLTRSRGVKVGTRLGEIDLVGLVGSSQKTFKDDLYGLGGSVYLRSNLTLGVNYVQDKNGQNSVASLDTEFALSPEMSLSGEYAWSSCKEDEIESATRTGNAFRIEASAYSEKLILDGSYERTDQNFCSPSMPDVSTGYEEYDFFLDYSFFDYMSGSFYYNHYSDSFQPGDIFRYSLADASLSFFLPKLPSLSIAYDISENFSNEDSEVLIDDTTNTFAFGLSYPIKKVRLSISHSRSNYEDRTEFPSQESTVSNTYAVSAPCGKYLVLSTHYGISDTKDLIALNTIRYRYVTWGVEYKIIPDKLSLSTQYKIGRNKDIENTVDNRKVTTTLTLSYYPTKRNMVRLGYVLTDEDNFIIGANAPTSDRENIYFMSHYNLTEEQSIELRYSLINGGEPTGSTTGSQNQSIHLTYNYRF
ncbi:hypothetical protein CEE34_06080 [Candidatus Aerophobetes bacterium Ae_b3a]|nr:MAG: hypothetical protein CEE34_06080 [Candidatus Aerophobetes bacterium Ae_b3a]